ncbi:MAG: fumarate hydratase [Eubacteriales bacterium]
MRVIPAQVISQAVAQLCITANQQLPPDVEKAILTSQGEETWAKAKESLLLLKENMDLAKEKELPICQDTGMVSVFVTLGQGVEIQGDFQEAIQEGVAWGYQEGFLRSSMVADPLNRVNTGDNTPASITVDLIEGDIFHLVLMPKGFGSENMSRLKMCKPSEGVQGVKDFVLETVQLAGPNACPPMVVGVGIGGNFDKVTQLAKKALLRPLDQRHKEEFYKDLEISLLEEVNGLGIGPQGFGGKTTALGLAIEKAPTHVAGLPVAVAINCHVTRRASCYL